MLYTHIPPQIQSPLLWSSIFSDRNIFLSTSSELNTSGTSDTIYLLCCCHIWSLSVFIHSIPSLTFPLPQFSSLFILNSFSFGVSSVLCHYVFPTRGFSQTSNRCLPAVFHYLVFPKFVCNHIITNKCSYIKFHIKTLKIAPTCFDPKIILRMILGSKHVGAILNVLMWNFM